MPAWLARALQAAICAALAAKGLVAAHPRHAYVGTARRKFDHGRQDPLRQSSFSPAAVEADPHRARHPARGLRPRRLPSSGWILDDPARAARALGGYSHCAPLASEACGVVASRPQERSRCERGGGVEQSAGAGERCLGNEPERCVRLTFKGKRGVQQRHGRVQ
jgi:hypothetical protein